MRPVMTGARRQRAMWELGVAGLAGGVLVALAAPGALTDRTVGWWYATPWNASPGLDIALVYAGMAVLAAAWAGLGRLVATRRWREAGPVAPGLRAPSAAQLALVAAAWTVPLAIGPPLFSRDLFSYLAQGEILRLGLDPYHATPAILAAHGHAHLLSAVSPFWRHTPAPYGPLFLGLVSVIAAATGSHLVAGVLAVRGLELVGGALLVVYLPRLSRTLGGDGARALWLGLLSPLVALQLIAAGHNDLLMAGLVAAGVAVALEGRPLAGIALCALAATIKVPALAAALFITVAWVRAEGDRRAKVRLAAAAAATVGCVLAAVGLATGAGVGWLTSTVFSTPARVRLAITPATGLGWTAAALLHGAGLGVSSRAVEGAFGVAVAALTAVAGVVLLARARVRRMAALLGAFLLLAAAGGPAAWPWYFIWGLVLVAAAPRWQRSAALAAALVVGAFLVAPDGILSLPIQTAPVVIAVYALLGALAWHRRARRRIERARPAAPAALTDPARLALPRT